MPPDPPTDLQVIAGSETTESLDISWVNPMFTGYSDISGFRVEILGGTNVINETFTGNESTTQRLLDGLEPFTLYTIRLFVRNAVGLEGTMSAETTGMTLSLRMLLEFYGIMHTLIPQLPSSHSLTRPWSSCKSVCSVT